MLSRIAFTLLAVLCSIFVVVVLFLATVSQPFTDAASFIGGGWFVRRHCELYPNGYCTGNGACNMIEKSGCNNYDMLWGDGRTCIYPSPNPCDGCFYLSRGCG